jgi:hypothetical protein
MGKSKIPTTTRNLKSKLKSKMPTSINKSKTRKNKPINREKELFSQSYTILNTIFNKLQEKTSHYKTKAAFKKTINDTINSLIYLAMKQKDLGCKISALKMITYCQTVVKSLMKPNIKGGAKIIIRTKSDGTEEVVEETDDYELKTGERLVTQTRRRSAVSDRVFFDPIPEEGDLYMCFEDYELGVKEGSKIGGTVYRSLEETVENVMRLIDEIVEVNPSSDRHHTIPTDRSRSLHRFAQAAEHEMDFALRDMEPIREAPVLKRTNSAPQQIELKRTPSEGVDDLVGDYFRSSEGIRELQRELYEAPQIVRNLEAVEQQLAFLKSRSQIPLSEHANIAGRAALSGLIAGLCFSTSDTDSTSPFIFPNIERSFMSKYKTALTAAEIVASKENSRRQMEAFQGFMKQRQWVSYLVDYIDTTITNGPLNGENIEVVLLDGNEKELIDLLSMSEELDSISNDQYIKMIAEFITSQANSDRIKQKHLKLVITPEKLLENQNALEKRLHKYLREMKYTPVVAVDAPEVQAIIRERMGENIEEETVRNEMLSCVHDTFSRGRSCVQNRITQVTTAGSPSFNYAIGCCILSLGVQYCDRYNELEDAKVKIRDAERYRGTIMDTLNLIEPPSLSHRNTPICANSGCILVSTASALGAMGSLATGFPAGIPSSFWPLIIGAPLAGARAWSTLSKDDIDYLKEAQKPNEPREKEAEEQNELEMNLRDQFALLGVLEGPTGIRRRRSSSKLVRRKSR